MSYTIENDRLVGVKFTPSQNVGGRMRARFGVVHETAGSSYEGALATLTKRKYKVSAHVLIGRKEGEIAQLVEFDRVAWHCEPARWNGIKDCNEISIGIELVGPGKMIRTGKYARAWYGRRYSIEGLGLEHIKTPLHGDGWWMPFTNWQLQTLDEIVQALVDEYELEDIRGHFEISPRRKVDPNPTLDMEDVRSAAYGTAQETPVAVGTGGDGPGVSSSPVGQQRQRRPAGPRAFESAWLRPGRPGRRHLWSDDPSSRSGLAG